MLLICTACSPSGPDGGNAAKTAGRSYATQTTAPAPDYRALLDQPVSGNGGWTQREATSPLPPDAGAIGETWLARMKERGALLGHGLAGPGGPVNMIDTGLTEAEFDSWVLENGWPVPAHIRWSFVPEMNLPRVSDAARDSIRVWPASTARTGPQNQALFSGRVELRDGCFFVGDLGRPADKLAWFHAEMGLDIDAAGYLVLRDRTSGHTLARIGEDMNWAGPANAEIEKESERALRDACGSGELLIVGSPEASERFLTQYPHLREPRAPLPPPPAAE